MSGGAALLIAHCRLAGLELTAEGDRLHVDSIGEPPAELIEKLRHNKAEVLAELRKANHVPLEQMILDRRRRDILSCHLPEFRSGARRPFWAAQTQ